MSTSEEWEAAYKRDPNATFEALLRLSKPPIGGIIVTRDDLRWATCQRDEPCPGHSDAADKVFDRLMKGRE